MIDDNKNYCLSFLDFLLRDLYTFMTDNPFPLLESHSNFDDGTLNDDLLDSYKKISNEMIQKKKRMPFFTSTSNPKQLDTKQNCTSS
jgi:hypothetical protein